jgi:ABC-type bacteriocin/lantibiotic exporter with double-glycine peptidase domain
LIIKLDTSQTSEMNQILEFVFPRKANISDLSFLFKVFFILIILAIINPEVWVVLLGVLLYFTIKIILSFILNK